MADEFSLIDKWFAPLSRHIGDDCALLEVDPGQRLAISVDTQVEGVHFFPATDPRQIAYRAAVAALSDLAAMGAKPRAMTLALTLPAPEDDWVQSFAAGIAEVLQQYQLELLGGDTTSGPLTVTVQVMGTLPLDRALTRSGAQVGDGVYLSGCTGDAAASLAQQKGELTVEEGYVDYLSQRFYRPVARVELGCELLGVASAAIDVSDGLLADAGHLCRSSAVGIRIDASSLPLSLALQSAPDAGQALQWALSGGDDYELLFSVPADKAHLLPPGCTAIGEVIAGNEVLCDVKIEDKGYRHFSDVTAGDAGEATAGENASVPQPRPFRSLAQFLAFGFGSGLSPRAPGTVGTLAAIPLYLLLSTLSLPLYSAALIAAFAAGIWICGRASRELGVHDHGGIVWDEFVGFWIAMWALPSGLWWLVAGFVLFRIFDVLKPWPISWCDRHVHGGLGIMIDDVLAGLASCAALHAMRLFL